MYMALSTIKAHLDDKGSGVSHSDTTPFYLDSLSITLHMIFYICSSKTLHSVIYFLRTMIRCQTLTGLYLGTCFPDVCNTSKIF